MQYAPAADYVDKLKHGGRSFKWYDEKQAEHVYNELSKLDPNKFSVLKSSRTPRVEYENAMFNYGGKLRLLVRLAEG